MKTIYCVDSTVRADIKISAQQVTEDDSCQGWETGIDLSPIAYSLSSYVDVEFYESFAEARSKALQISNQYHLRLLHLMEKSKENAGKIFAMEEPEHE